MGALQLFLQSSLRAPGAVADEADEDAGQGDEAGAHRQVGEVVQRQGRAQDGVAVVDDRGVAQRNREDGDDCREPTESDGRGDGHHEVGEEEG